MKEHILRRFNLTYWILENSLNFIFLQPFVEARGIVSATSFASMVSVSPPARATPVAPSTNTVTTTSACKNYVAYPTMTALTTKDASRTILDKQNVRKLAIYSSVDATPNAKRTITLEFALASLDSSEIRKTTRLDANLSNVRSTTTAAERRFVTRTSAGSLV